ncbi:MAG: ABC transporter substrate-binding protein [Acetobacter orientalis]|uniref:ABC transporter substrate-binding protein n=1 Tax=Acetobacter orientalis TaxID=146474 RepID=UPI0039EAE21B
MASQKGSYADDLKEPVPDVRSGSLTKRGLISGACALSTIGLGAYLFGRAVKASPLPFPKSAQGLTRLRVSLPMSAVCVAPIVAAEHYGIFRSYGIEPSFLSWTKTDALLETLATAKADIGIGMIMQFMKPLEQGYNVKLVAGTHGGCMRIVGSKKQGISSDITSLKGKTIGLTDINGFAYNTFALLLHQHGINPNKDVAWRSYPDPLLPMALEKRDIQAYAGSDPLMYLAQERANGDLIEILSNLSGSWHNLACCVVATGTDTLKRDRQTIYNFSMAALAAAELCANDPEKVAQFYKQYSKSNANLDDIVKILTMQTHHVHPMKEDLCNQIRLYTQQLRDIGVFNSTTDPGVFSKRITENLVAERRS